MNKKSLVAYLLIFAIINGVAYIITESNTQQNINTILEKNRQTLQAHYDTLLYTQDLSAKIIHNDINKKKEFIKIFSEAVVASTEKRAVLRKRAQKILAGMHTRVKMRGVLQLHFVFPNNVSFLRMHRPSKYGDDLTSVRGDFKYVNETQKPIRVFSRGRVTHGFRNTFPMFNNEGKHIGAMEVSFSSDNIQNYLTNVAKIHTHFLVDKIVLESLLWKQNDPEILYAQSAESKRLMLALTTSHPKKDCVSKNGERLKPIQKSLEESIGRGEPFSAHVKHDDYTDIISFLPIKNIKQQTVAWLVTYTKNRVIGYLLSTAMYARIFSLLFSIIVIISLVMRERAKNRQDELYHEMEEKVAVALADNTKQLQILQEQNKLAAMGEMIGAIAHQWRQPLNELGLAIQNLKYDYKAGKVNELFLQNFIGHSKKIIMFMSDTIDDFRGFFKVEKEKEDFSVKKVTESVLSMQSAQLKHYGIKVSLFGEGFTYHGFQNEYCQVILNIINNAKDALIENRIEDPIITLTIQNHKVSILDNAGGIPKGIISRVFEPYFTTKEQGKGTGMGLYMSKMIIEKNMGGKLKVKSRHGGALFVIDFS